MKTKLSILLTVLMLGTFTINAQTSILQENFTTYQGTSITLPTGWSTNDYGFYSSVTDCGPSGSNSLKLNMDSAYLDSPTFGGGGSGGDSLSFWYKAYGTDSASSYLWVTMEAQNSSSNLSVCNLILTNLKTTGKILKFGYSTWNSSGNSYKLKHVNFLFRRGNSTGNIAIDDINVKSNNLTGLASHSLNSNFSIFPNPGSGIFNLQLFNIGQNTDILVYNTIGEKVYEKIISQQQSEVSIDISSQPKGIYSVVICSNEQRYFTKIIVQ